VGNIFGNITNSAALGTSITATGGGTRKTGRVYGGVANNDEAAQIGTASNSHGYNDMKFYESNTYGAGGISPTKPSSIDNTTTVEGRGYPILRGSVSGPALGGQ
jgi:hypothetical protein